MGLFDDIGGFVNNAVQAVGSYYGFDSEGKWTNQGGVFKWADEGVGELTGRNQSRASLNLARDQFDYSKKQSDNLIEQRRWEQKQGDIKASDQAAAMTATSNANNGATMTNSAPTARGPGFGGGAGIQPPKDFLGL